MRPQPWLNLNTTYSHRASDASSFVSEAVYKVNIDYIIESGTTTSSPASSVGMKAENSDDEAPEGEEEDTASKARKKLGLPAYDPDACLVDSLPAILPLSKTTSNINSVMRMLRFCKINFLCRYIPPNEAT